MNSGDPAPSSRTASLSLEVELRHPPEKVWRALTDPTLLAQWLLPAVGFELKPGTAFSLHTQPHPGWDGTVNCRMLEIEPLRKLRYAWAVPSLDTVVTFTLTPTASGTRLSIEQSGFQPDQKQALGGARYGWKTMSDRLVDVLASTA